MGLFGMLNKASGYSEEKMNQTFNGILSQLNDKAICPIAVSFKRRVSLFQSKVYGSGFATLTEKGALVVHVLMPVKGTAIYNFNSPKKLTVKDAIAGQKVMEGTFLNLYSKQFEELILQFGPKVEAFPNQNDNFDLFLSYLNDYKTK